MAVLYLTLRFAWPIGGDGWSSQRKAVLCLFAALLQKGREHAAYGHISGLLAIHGPQIDDLGSTWTGNSSLIWIIISSLWIGILWLRGWSLRLFPLPLFYYIIYMAGIDRYPPCHGQQTDTHEWTNYIKFDDVIKMFVHFRTWNENRAQPNGAVPRPWFHVLWGIRICCQFGEKRQRQVRSTSITRRLLC